MSILLNLKHLSLLTVLLLLTQTLFAQFTVETTIKESRCSANGQIILKVTGGIAPYSYQIVGSVVPPQTNDTFKLLPPATYQIRITDNNGRNQVITATVFGNYRPPTVQCSVSLKTVTLSPIGGRLPYRYAYSLNDGQIFTTPNDSSIINCMPNGNHNFRIYDSCDNFQTTSCQVDVPPLSINSECKVVNGKLNITTNNFSGGQPPYLFTCIGIDGDTTTNTTGNFLQLASCGYKLIFKDNCNSKIEQLFNCTTLKGYVKCASFHNGTATVYAEGGKLPYRFSVLGTTWTNNNGLFTNLPTDFAVYNFQVRDSCDNVYDFSVNNMAYFRPLSSVCPPNGTVGLRLEQKVDLPDSCGNRCSMFYPYRFDCLNCTPPRTEIDSNVQTRSPLKAYANFSPQAAGTYQIRVTNGCQDTIVLNYKTRAELEITVEYDCKTKTIKAAGGPVGTVYSLHPYRSARPLTSNTTGIFISPYQGEFTIIAAFTGCDTTAVNFSTVVVTDICYALSSKVNSTTGVCEFKWKLVASGVQSTTYQLTNLLTNVSSSNTTGIFTEIEPNTRYILKTECTTDTILTNPAVLPNLQLSPYLPCSDRVGILATGGRSTFNCFIRYEDTYLLYDSTGRFISSNKTGFFPSLIPNNLYEVRLQNPEGCVLQTARMFVRPYSRPNLFVSYGVVCATGQTTGNIRAILRGGFPPYTFQITSPAGLRPPITTRDSSVIFYNLPTGSYILRAFDSCGSSSDYATSVGPLNFTPQYKWLCNGKLTIEVPFIDSAVYKWTNAAGIIVGTNRILETNDTTAQTYTINITTPQPCNFTTTINIPRFTGVNLRTNAGIDFVSTNATTNLNATPIPQGFIGRWRQIAPTNGTTTFANANSPTSVIVVSNFPSEYIYVWEVNDPISGCTVTDTVVVTFCNTAFKLNANIVITNTICRNNTGKATITITNATTPLTYQWSNGKTTASVDSLAVGTYFVTVNDTQPCSPPRIDTIVIKEPTAIAPRLIDTTLCVGTNFKVGLNTYTQAGNYKDTLRSIANCDSIILTNLKFSRVPTERLILARNLTAAYCGDSLALNARGDSSVNYKWNWQNVSCISCFNPKILPLSKNTYFVTITDKTTQCTAKDSVLVTVEGGFTERIPDAFTPNSDGVNDVFNVIPDNCIKTVSRLRIYNRLGNLVFDKNNLSPQKNEGWTGAINNTLLVSDVYVYIMEILLVDDTIRKVSGEVSLIR